MRFCRRAWKDRQPTHMKLGLVILLVSALFVFSTLLGADVTADSSQSYKITIVVDGSEWEYVSGGTTVGAILSEAGIQLGPKDEISPQLKTTPTEGMKVRIARVTEKVITQTEPIKYKTKTKFDPRGKSEKTVLRKGVSGEKQVTYRLTHKDGVQSKSKVLKSKVTKRPVDEVIAVSRTTFLASRAGSYTRSVTMIATAYDPSPRCCGPRATGRTASGTRAGKGVVAVDPRFIRLGTKLYVEGYGFCIAEDTGGAIKGNRIDLCFNSYAEAVRYGRRTVKVYILD